MNAGSRVWLRQEDGENVRDQAGDTVAFFVTEVQAHRWGTLCELTADDPVIHILYAGWHPVGRLTQIGSEGTSS
ncbi:hypothetical protein [Streptomyces sp. TBY4]|uniref:hypothetical protein n=1 Tax=Streptomyces sp. TBY4 TaxID=2962030 RepID=UPI0020B7F623|nr:hypothetical protein [Streptomyces sp. TBY4]MCP3759655.1 hypothetical protein [Streptomyces sp. TBY4]